MTIRRWAWPAALLVVEYLALSLLVDLPTGEGTGPLVDMLRLAGPVLLASAGAGWLLARAGPESGGPPLPPWRPWPALALQPLAFLVTCGLAWSLLGPGRGAPSTAALAVWLVPAGLSALLALASAVPLPWLARWLAARWGAPLLAILLGALAWRAALAAEGAWGLFSGGTLGAAASLLRAMAGAATLDPAARVIGLGDFEVIVAPICSGVDGAGLVVMFLATWVALARERLRVGRALLLLPLGALAALGANVVRIAALVWLGGAGHEDLAMGGFHSKAGWVVFLALGLAGVAIAERLPWLRRGEAPRATAGVPVAAGAYLGPLLAALAVGLLTGLFTEGQPDPWYGMRIAAAAAALAASRRSLPRLRTDASGVLVGALVGGATCLAWVAWTGEDGAALSAWLDGLSPVARNAWLAQRLVGAILVIPIIEELAFRGFLLPWLISPAFEAVPPRTWTLAAVLLSSLAFGALHGNWALGALSGVAFAAVRCWRGRLADAVVAHAACNAGIAVAVLWGGRFSLWL